MLNSVAGNDPFRSFVLRAVLTRNHMFRSSLLLLILVSVTANADDQRAELFERANAGDTAAQEELDFSYSHWSSVYWNKERAIFWRCLAAKGGSERALRAFKDDENWSATCDEVISEGEKLGYNKYFPSGQFISNIEFASADEMPMVVPSERIWKLTWTTTECPRVCTSDIRVNGYLFIGADKATSVEGQMEFTGTDNESVLWLWPGTELTLLRPLADPSIQEFAQ